MSKFSFEERQRILNEARSNLERAEASHNETSSRDEVDAAAALAFAMAQPCESWVDRTRREIASRDEQWAEQARQREREAEATVVDLDQRIASAIAVEHAYMQDLLVELIAGERDRQADAIDAAVQPWKSELLKLEAKLAELKVWVCELRVAESKSRSHDIIDLPAFAPRREMN